MLLAAEVPIRHLLERGPFQCSVECGWSGSFYTVAYYNIAVGHERAMNIINKLT